MMELWTEYEGRTIDGAFRLTKLIRPEGRSAFFSTSNGTGIPTVIRLIESHFDDDEILARWRGVQALDHANLVKLKSFGQVMVDETSLVYAVMEPVEANLAEILAERRLTVVETKQIATSLVAAVGALHSNGFVHEHIEPANVLAVGEEIKLRSDCIRETPEGDEGVELKRWDVYDLSVVLLQSLTQHKTLEEAVLHNNWPTLAAARGKVVFLMDQRAVGPVYLEAHPSLRGRVLFTNAEPGQPDCAFTEENEGSREAIAALVRKGYLVRTRTDADTKQARTNDTSRRDLALASGAQLLSTDYPSSEPSPWTGYSVSFPDGAVARCNPVNGPPSCSNAEFITDTAPPVSAAISANAPNPTR